ncbi:MAG: transposase [Candidatus Omnitrophica bacterium]|nr:transposase [Candidatus Omnitrophota bacterium]
MADFNNVLDLNNPVDTIDNAIKRLNDFIAKWGKIYPSIRRMFIRKEEYFSYIKMPFLMRRMIYTNNWIENLNRQIKRTTNMRGSFPNPKSAEKLVVLKCIEIENNYMQYPVTALLPIQDYLEDMLDNRKMSVAQTH